MSATTHTLRTGIKIMEGDGIFEVMNGEFHYLTLYYSRIDCRFQIQTSERIIKEHQLLSYETEVSLMKEALVEANKLIKN